MIDSTTYQLALRGLLAFEKLAGAAATMAEAQAKPPARTPSDAEISGQPRYCASTHISERGYKTGDGTIPYATVVGPVGCKLFAFDGRELCEGCS